MIDMKQEGKKEGVLIFVNETFILQARKRFGRGYQMLEHLRLLPAECKIRVKSATFRGSKIRIDTGDAFQV